MVWDFEKVRQMKQFTWQPDKYRFKSCRYMKCTADMAGHEVSTCYLTLCCWVSL